MTDDEWIEIGKTDYEVKDESQEAKLDTKEILLKSQYFTQNKPTSYGKILPDFSIDEQDYSIDKQDPSKFYDLLGGVE